MAKAKKLPSGQYRTQVYDYTDNDGKRHYRSFTASTKRESERQAANFAADKDRYSRSDYTFKEAMNKYIDLKSNVLSQSSIRGYIQMKTYFTGLDDIKLSRINQNIITEWVNIFSINHSPKTVRNAHGLISAILREFAPEIVLNTKLPQKITPKYHIPSDAEIKRIIVHLSTHDKEMLKAVYLAAFGTLRRSEVCGLSAEDIQGLVIHVRRAMVKDKNHQFVLKTTKTVSSDRYIELPDFVIAALPERGTIVNLTPDAITHRFYKLLKSLDIKHFRFHDLRHYSASIMHAIGVPDQYIMARGGWKSDTVLKAIYRGVMDEYDNKFSNTTNNYFSNMQHEMQHENK